MSLYNMLFGMNSQADLLLAVIGLRKNDVERFRDVHASSDGVSIEVYTRTGGGNRGDYPNIAMRKRPEWSGSADDDFDSTYCTDTFTVPEQWRNDVVAIRDPFRLGIRPEFGAHLLRTLEREPTAGDLESLACDAERAALLRTAHVMANGHTFVPHDDAAMEAALKIAEANGGKLRICWGIMPLALTVKRNNIPWPKAKDPKTAAFMRRLDVGYEWEIDDDYWQHCQLFHEQYPVSMRLIAEAVRLHKERRP